MYGGTQKRPNTQKLTLYVQRIGVRHVHVHMQVLAQFIKTDLAACRAAIAREERRVNFWRKVTLAGCGILGAC